MTYLMFITSIIQLTLAIQIEEIRIKASPKTMLEFIILIGLTLSSMSILLFNLFFIPAASNNRNYIGEQLNNEYKNTNLDKKQRYCLKYFGSTRNVLKWIFPV